MGEMPARLVLIENDDKGGVRSHPGTVDAIAAVLDAWRHHAGQVEVPLRDALAALNARWPL